MTLSEVLAAVIAPQKGISLEIQTAFTNKELNQHIPETRGYYDAAFWLYYHNDNLGDLCQAIARPATTDKCEI